MTPRNERFIELYIQYVVLGQPPSGKRASAAQAWIDAGYKPKDYHTAEVNASEFLSKPENKIEVEKIQIELLEREKITSEKILREISLIGFVNMADFYKQDGTLKQINELTRDQTAVIQEVCHDKNGKFLGYKLFNKIDGLDRLGRNKKLFINQTEVIQPPEGFNVNVIKLSPEERRARIDALNAKRGNGTVSPPGDGGEGRTGKGTTKK
jgi:hypothetical protein